MGPAVGGRLAWAPHGDLDFIGSLWTDLPYRLSPRHALFAGVEGELGLIQPEGFSFAVTDLQYRVRAGWRGRPTWARGLVLSGGLAMRGREQVDEAGQPWLRYAFVGAESASFREHRVPESSTARLDWRFTVGRALDEREVAAQAVTEGRVSWWLARAGRGGVALDLDWDAVVEDGLDADLEIGPRIAWPVAGGRTVSLFARYRGAETPLGNDEALLLVGASYEEGTSSGAPSLEPPEIDGTLAAGGGEGRLAGEMSMRFLFPPVLGAWYPMVWIEGDILTADETGDVYFLYALGFERRQGRAITGAWFYHRSNHVLAEPNDRVTSINVCETGLETAGWHSPAGRAPRKLDGSVRLGWLTRSTFGEDRRWHVRAGGRYSPLAAGRFPRPYLWAEVESGDVTRESFALGVAPTAAVELQAEYRHDEQLFAEDRTVVLLMARYGF